jgi:hypothetical protein
VGLGCYVNPGVSLPYGYGWASSPAYSDSASEADVRIVCGCRL